MQSVESSFRAEFNLRFWKKVEATGFCWLWTAHVTPKGYGQFGLDGKMRSVHRLAYEWLVGPIPEEMVLDHLCRVRHCVNPDHLEVVTVRENNLRGFTIASQNHSKTHCKRGHPFDKDNTYQRKDGRECQTCKKNLARKRPKRNWSEVEKGKCPVCQKEMIKYSLNRHLRQVHAVGKK